MPGLRKITVDAPNGRVIESAQNPRLARKPVFYAGETVSVDVNPVELAVQSDSTVAYETIRPGGANTVGMRLGTTTTLVAQGTEFSYTAPPRFQATLSFTTVPAVTIPLSIEVRAVPTTPLQLDVIDFKPAETGVSRTYGAVTALISATIENRTIPAVTIPVPLEDPDVFRYPGFEVFIAGTCVTFSSLVNSPVSASFSVITVADAVTSIGISSGGSGYPDGTYSLTFTGGTVTSVAEATCVASGGAIVSVTIVTGGSGYVTKPAASLFTPARRITAVNPSISLAVVNDRPRFHWHRPLTGQTAVTLSVSAPTSTSTPVTVISPVVRMEYVTLDAEGMPVWEINVVCAGYGYVGAPAVSAPAHTVSGRRRSTSAVVAGNNLNVGVLYDNEVSATAEEGSLIPGADPYHFALSGQFYRRRADGASEGTGPFDDGAIGAELRAGTFELRDSTNTVDGNGKFVVLSPERGVLGRKYLSFGIGSRDNVQRITFEPGQFLAQNYRDLAGRSFICAVIPQRRDLGSTVTLHALNETAPDRYAIVRVSFRAYPGGQPDYYVGQAYEAVRANPVGVGSILVTEYAGLVSGTENTAGFGPMAPGGGFFEPTIEFLDYGKGYKTTQFVGTNAHQRYTYNLRVLSGLRSGHVIDDTPTARSVTAITTGALDKDSFIQTAYSQRASTVTFEVDGSIRTVIDQPGFGYQQSGYFLAGVVTVAGKLRSVRLLNRPSGYGLGKYTCTVTGGGGSGGQVELLVNRRVSGFGPLSGAPQVGAEERASIQYTYSIGVRVVCAGSGYTSVPSVIAPAPEFAGLSVVSISINGGVQRLGNHISTPITVSGNRASIIGYESSDDAALVGRPDPDGSGRRIGTPSRRRFYGAVCNGVYYKITTWADRRNETGTTAFNLGFNERYTTDPAYPAPDGFEIVDNVTEYEFSVEPIKYPLTFSPSPEPLGTAEGFAVFPPFVLQRKNRDGRPPSFFITKSGFGYVTKPTVTIQAPPIQGYYISSVSLAAGFGADLPDFYGNLYPAYDLFPRLVPTSGIPTTTTLPVDFRADSGFACVVSPSPILGADDLRVGCRVLNFDEVKPPNHAAQVANKVPFAVERERVWNLYDGKKVLYAYRSLSNEPAIYATSPTVSAPTFSGFAIASVTVVCQGYWYSRESATLTDLDPTGTGAVITVSEVKNGKITKVELREGGAGYSANPQIIFSQPDDNPSDLPSLLGVKANLAISAASASSVLGTAGSADALLEIYENEGATQQVIAQVPVTLAKRVSAT